MKALLKLLRYLGNYSGVLVVALILLVLSSLLGVVQPRITEWIIDAGIRAGKASIVWQGAAAILIAGLLGSIFSFASNYAVIRAAQGMGCELRNDLYRKVMSLSFHSLDRYRTGELIVRLNSDVNTIRMFIRMGLLMVVQASVYILGAIAIMYTTNARLATVMAVFMPAVLALFLGVTSFVKPLFKKVREAMDALNNVVQENLSGAKTVRAFARRDAEVARFADRNRELNRLSFRVGMAMSGLFPVFFFFAQIGVLLTLWLGGREILASAQAAVPASLSLGQLVAFSNYAMMAMFPILMLGFVANFISMAAASAERLGALMATSEGIVEKPGAISAARLLGRIEFRDVRFHYASQGGTGPQGPGGQEDCLKGISLAIEAGERIGIIGPTGSGKTSLVSLIPRFYDASSGSVLVDGIDVRDYSLETLRGRISLAFQETVLFKGSIRENLAFGRPEASEAELERAAQVACASDIVGEKGWDGLVGERGTGLSGGQRQRLAIARAVVADPDILILDDSTSSLDSGTEGQVMEALFSGARDKTLVVVSQKAQAVRRADRIVVMDEGEIRGTGTHEELFDGNPVYRAICDTQEEGR